MSSSNLRIAPVISPELGERVTFKAQSYDAYGNEVSVRLFWGVSPELGRISVITGTFVAGDTPGTGNVVAFASDIFGFGGADITGTAKVTVVSALPSEFHLAQNVPNPFNPVTHIPYDLPEAADVTLSIYTLTGQQVATLVSAHQEAGHYKVAWDGSGCANGVYLYRLKAGHFVQTRRMVLLK